MTVGYMHGIAEGLRQGYDLLCKAAGEWPDGSEQEGTYHAAAGRLWLAHRQAAEAADRPAPDVLAILKTTAGNIRSLGPAGALGALPTPYEVWLAEVEAAIAAVVAATEARR